MIGKSPFARRKSHSFAERKATLSFAPERSKIGRFYSLLFIPDRPRIAFFTPCEKCVFSGLLSISVNFSQTYILAVLRSFLDDSKSCHWFSRELWHFLARIFPVWIPPTMNFWVLVFIFSTLGFGQKYLLYFTVIGNQSSAKGRAVHPFYGNALGGG